VIHSKIQGLVVGTVFLMGLTSCGLSGAPDCGDGEVKETLENLVMNQARQKVLLLNVLGQNPDSVALLASDDTLMFKTLSGGLSYEDLVAIADENKHAEKLIDTIDDAMDDFEVSLTNIRIQQKDDELKKVICKAEITVDNGKNPFKQGIDYSAQYNDDGEVYVETSGINYGF